MYEIYTRFDQLLILFPTAHLCLNGVCFSGSCFSPLPHYPEKVSHCFRYN